MPYRGNGPETFCGHRLVSQTESGNYNNTDAQRTSQWQYDAVGNQVAAIDAGGRTTTTAYDRLNRAVLTTTPESDVKNAGPDVTTVALAYNAAGQLVRETRGDANGLPGEYEVDQHYYDAGGRRILSVDGRGAETARRYDPSGNLAELVDPAGNITHYAYDGLDRIDHETIYQNGVPLVRDYDYDRLGRLESTVDRNGRKVSYAYDRLDRVTAEFWYDAQTNLTDYVAPPVNPFRNRSCRPARPKETRQIAA